MMELLQVASEIAPVLDMYREKKPERVLEIGCWDGGTLKLWLEESSPALVVAVDLEHRNRDAYEAWRKPETELVLYTGSSIEEEQIAAIRAHAPYDWVLIDGDHSSEYVRSDVAVCLPLIRQGGTLLLHDIVPEDGLPDYPPGVLLNELERDGRTVRRFVDPTPMPWAHGLGVVYL